MPRRAPDLPTFFSGRGVLPVTMKKDGRLFIAFYSSRDAGMTWRFKSLLRTDLFRRD
jgi:hypothetical protein